MKTAIMVAKAANNVIGKDNDLVWHLPADLRHFKNTTSGHYVIMGRKTYESMGKPLPNRLNIVITRNRDYFVEGAVVVHSLDDALEFARTQNQKLVFILGGGEIYKQALPIVDELYITEIHDEFEGDTLFPQFDQTEWEEVERHDFQTDNDNRHPYSFVRFKRS
jgi:dihydrofolate reductase